MSATIGEDFYQVSQLGVAADGPDEELVADPARRVLGPRPPINQVQLETVWGKQQGQNELFMVSLRTIVVK